MLFPPKITKYSFFVKPTLADFFLFPITGLEIEDKLCIGSTVFYSVNGPSIKKDIVDEPFISYATLYKDVITVAYVDTTSANEAWKKQCHNNLSIALMLIKQAIGFLYLIYFEERGFSDQRRIIISKNNKQEYEEGMDYYISDKGIQGSDISSSLLLKPSGDFFNILNCRQAAFLDLYTMDCEMKLKKLKSVESLYSLLNEVHSLERILKISAFMNFIFIPIGKESDFPPIANKIRILVNRYGVKIDMGERTGKLNSELCEIYNRVRNQYAHGKIDLYQEYNVIGATDYFIFLQSFMHLLILLIYHNDFHSIQTTDDLLSAVNSNGSQT